MIHGGMTFKKRKDYLRYLRTRNVNIEDKKTWSREYFDKELGKKFEIIRPRMPLQDNARYEDWAIWFKRHVPYLKENVILIGGSLGGIFLAKYLSENKFPKKILATFLICPPFDNTLLELNENVVNGFFLKKDLSLIEKNSLNIYLMFSKDDDVVPVSHAEKYRNKLIKAKIIIYESKNGHFQISKFPEIVKIIKNLK
jgi:predicted alpha/beta hydrolase family esterase